MQRIAIICWITWLTWCCIGCDNSLEVYAPYKETPVIYAVLDAGLDSQVIRIGKTFQIENEAAKGASDSLLGYFNELLEVYVTDKDGNSWVFNQIVYYKDSGIYHPKTVAYVNAFNFKPKFGATYNIHVRIPSLQKTIIAQTTICDSPLLYYFKPTSEFNQTSSNDFSIINGFNAKIHDCIIRMQYTETLNGLTKSKHIDYFVGQNQLTDRRTLPERVNFLARGKDWIDYLRLAMPEVSGLVRTYVRTEIIWKSGNEDFLKAYYQSQPSLFFVQKSTNTSNIPDALGFIGSTHTYRIPDAVITPSLLGQIKQLPNMVN